MKKYIILISSIVSIWLTAYFSLLPLNWVTQADVSWLYPTFITPTWFTFSIWGVIYLSWLILWIYLIVKNPKDITKKEIYYLASAQILSAIWLIPWHYQIICITFSIIFLILWILYYLIITPPKDIFFRKVSELYFWWILVATILNFNVFLVFKDKYTYWLIIWIISILIWAIANRYLLNKYSTYISSIVLIWALIWIIIWQMHDYIILSSIIGIYIITLSIILKLIKK